MQIKFNDSEQIYNITSFRQIGNNLIILKGTDLPQSNTSGFVTMKDGTVTGYYSNFTVKYNVLTQLEAGVMMLSNSDDYIETEDNPAGRYFYQPSAEQQQSMLQEAKEERIAQSKTALAEFLAENPLISTVHGKEAAYSVTTEKQSLMMSQYMTYQVEKAVNQNARLTWNESGQECEEWTEAEFLQLILEVKQYVYPLVSFQQSIEKSIRDCTTDEELDAIEIDYSTIIRKGEVDETDM